MASSLRVKVTAPFRSHAAKERPAHWANEQGTTFKNPWPSFRAHDWQDQYYIVFQWSKRIPKIPDDIATLLPVAKPTWGLDADASRDSMKVTWLGHATVLLEMPARTSINSEDPLPNPPRGIRILFDPIFSERCSPVQFAGPKRITPSPCQVPDLPEIDAVVFSHDHFDHLDANTLRALLARPHPPHVFAPAGNAPTLHALGVPAARCHILDWWESRRLDLPGGPAVDLTCTPAQHNSGRAFSDRFFDARTLWASWAVEEVIAYFGGDTGYRATRDGVPEADTPSCPAFAEIGARFGGFDVAFLPIGAYKAPRFMSPVHCSPRDSVQVFRALGAKRALGIHWGTFILGEEGIMDPPREVKEEAAEAGLEEDAFTTCGIGETLLF
ncbi:hypothetical protein PHLGIDRAFT_105453 [Phlebiopsis gigantea 11061_1 CR5-6]|uniref:Metallo-beta-lactamase domain-containing protein n=1 Tax=Phlebiopsis gigantea (strain 11061_1 CR5-6) TaxID=745531 RepID=A0A0C3RZ62_PHLG1|nr:hypothetical protein PHLGIDRAFT_105453 [Phlebiopsis gigantea 11061_1 CR5-6]